MTQPDSPRIKMGLALAMTMVGGGCSAVSGAPPLEVTTVWTNATLPGGRVVDVAEAHGRIVSVTLAGSRRFSADVLRIDLWGRWLVPAPIDAHVHLTYADQYRLDDDCGAPDCRAATQLAHAGLAAVVDLGAPFPSLLDPPETLQVRASGPMLTAPEGYPLNSWGRDGYGWPVRTAEEAEAAVQRFFDAGAKVVKLPLEPGPSLSDAVMSAAIARAHALGMTVVVHAMDDAAVLRAARLSADVLAHVPTARLSSAAVAAWSDGAVITTLAAFGGRPVPLDNVRRLSAAGATVLYGTDFGNRLVIGIDPREIELMVQAGLSAEDIAQALTEHPARTFGFSDLGAIEAGYAARFWALPADPHQRPEAWTAPVARYPEN